MMNETEPVRNLSQAFEALEQEHSPPAVGLAKEARSWVSPTAVSDELESSSAASMLHQSLRLDLTPALCQRVSIYAVIHDMNKEVQEMETKDPLPEEEAYSELVTAVTGEPRQMLPSREIEQAMIDEEAWLLSVTDARNTEQRDCPPTFLQAMGEKEYENPIASLSTRTQLWKPSRSWWEAKSGKNPWIEPSMHNKRWRYLWPLIHYHKFLAKCIKKLKRNGIDVKHCVSPLAVFLREDVCAVSDHLARVSLYGSEEWMNCLQYFEGWVDTSPEGEQAMRDKIAQLRLRPIQEPGDVDSPLLRSQIDEQFLRAMAEHRRLMREHVDTRRTPKAAVETTTVAPSPQVPKHVVPSARRWGYHWYHYQPQGYSMEPPSQYVDNSSVHSGLSADSSYPHHQQMYGMYPHVYGPYGQPDVSQSSSGYTSTHMYPWIDPSMYQMVDPSAYYPQPPNEPQETFATPYKQSPESNNMASPYWSHLDQATLAMGLATPAKATPPRRKLKEADGKKDTSGFVNAHPPLLRQQYCAYPTQGYGPPSPATQFMMSPQHAGFAYNNFTYPTTSPQNRTRSSPNQSKAIVGTPEADRESVSTVDTTTESDSLVEATS